MWHTDQEGRDAVGGEAHIVELVPDERIVLDWWFVGPGRAVDTYFVGSRGGADAFLPTSALLDLTPLGRGEQWEDTPPGRPRAFWSPGDTARAQHSGGG